MAISGALGSLSAFILYGFQIGFDADASGHLYIYILGAIGAGVFTNFGVVANAISISYGSVEVTSLFANMRVIVQMVEEFLIFSIVPSVISFLGIILAIVGSTIMIKFENQDTHNNKGWSDTQDDRLDDSDDN